MDPFPTELQYNQDVTVAVCLHLFGNSYHTSIVQVEKLDQALTC